MNYQQNYKPYSILVLNIFAFILAYYVSTLFHEWGHGTVAWLYKLKLSPFNIQYGGWALLHVDENVNYTNLLNSGQGIKAALIGIAGPCVSLSFVLISVILLKQKKILESIIGFSLVYWFLIINMIPIIQYFTVSAFSTEGDTGRFIHGLNISGWWVFIPGTIFNIYMLYRIMRIEMIKAYKYLHIRTVIMQNVYLLVTLSTLFLLIYTHGFNPITNTGIHTFSKILAVTTILLVPILFIFCNPTRGWVKQLIQNQQAVS